MNLLLENSVLFGNSDINGIIVVIAVFWLLGVANRRRKDE
jgi:hypothetical protein